MGTIKKKLLAEAEKAKQAAQQEAAQAAAAQQAAAQQLAEQPAHLALLDGEGRVQSLLHPQQFPPCCPLCFWP